MKPDKKTALGYSLALGLPAALLALFYLLRGNRAAMDAWVFGVMAPAEQLLGRVWSALPFSMGEALTAAALLGAAAWTVRLLALAARQRNGKETLRRVLALAAAVLWLWAAFSWMWNAAYGASTFSTRSGLAAQPYTAEELARVTALFARRAGELSAQVERDGEGHFAVSRQVCLTEGVRAYENIVREFPLLDIPAVRAKPLACSRLQSILGFTGVYFPLTGEANVNVDFPACLLPATIAHEMAHQRMVAAEEEANFVGIAAAVTCGSTVYQYSGCLMGLMHLSSALYSADRDAWYGIRAGFPQELVTDWNDNSAYWAEFSSPIEEAAGNAYDSYLKGNGQSLGMRSYGACVDLLVAWLK